MFITFFVDIHVSISSNVFIDIASFGFVAVEEGVFIDIASFGFVAVEEGVFFFLGNR
tara:strand:- start:951 stop:1121 length:171 start_codon:yes stop_codon:yes gene_type:complete